MEKQPLLIEFWNPLPTGENPRKDSEPGPSMQRKGQKRGVLVPPLTGNELFARSTVNPLFWACDTQEENRPRPLLFYGLAGLVGDAKYCVSTKFNRLPSPLPPSI